MPAACPSIIVPLDGSPTSETALPLALALARRAGSPVTLVHVHDVGVIVANAPMVDSAWEDDRAMEMRDTFRAMAERLSRDTGLRVSAVTMRGLPAPSLVQHAVDANAGLIVMSTHGRSGVSRAWFGSVAEEVIHSAQTPILVVRAGDHARADVTEPLFRHVLLPIDREQSGAEAVQHALALGTAGQTTYTLLTVVATAPVVPPPLSTLVFTANSPSAEHPGAAARSLLERLAEPARTSGAAMDVRVVTHERAAPAILEMAESHVDLIVMPLHRRGKYSRTLFGSVADKVMRGAFVPLLLFAASRVDEELPTDASLRPLASAAFEV